jgi:hypothetical protein
MLPFALYFLLTRADDCGARTPVFQASGPVNSYNRYYVYTTPPTDPSVCQANVPALSFANSVRVGSSCSPGTSGCIAGVACGSGSLCFNCACYVEGYVIPLVNNIQGLAGCNFNLFSNMAMVNPWWYGQLNGAYVGEREAVFGALFGQAYNETYKCCKGSYPATIPSNTCISAPPPPNSVSKLTASVWAVLVTWLLL